MPEFSNTPTSPGPLPGRVAQAAKPSKKLRKVKWEKPPPATTRSKYEATIDVKPPSSPIKQPRGARQPIFSSQLQRWVSHSGNLSVKKGIYIYDFNMGEWMFFEKDHFAMFEKQNKSSATQCDEPYMPEGIRFAAWPDEDDSPFLTTLLTPEQQKHEAMSREKQKQPSVPPSLEQISKWKFTIMDLLAEAKTD